MMKYLILVTFFIVYAKAYRLENGVNPKNDGLETVVLRNAGGINAKETKANCEVQKADICFIIDSSTSIWPREFSKDLQFVSNVVDGMNIGPDNVNVGVVEYSTKAHFQWGLKEYLDKTNLQKAIKQMTQYFGNTNTGAALMMAKDEVFSKTAGGRGDKVPKIAIVITDGNSQDEYFTLEQANALKAMKVTVIAVGVGTSISQYELSNIATSKNHIYTVDDYDTLVSDAGILKKLIEKTCETEVGEQKDEGCGGKGADIAFVSGITNAGGNDIVQVRDFFRDVAKRFSIGPTKVQVASVPQSCTDTPGFLLKTYGNKPALLSALEPKIKQETVAVLKELKSHTFLSENGGRRGVPKIAILVTDDETNTSEIERLAAENQRAGVTFYVIGVGPKPNRDLLAKIAGDQNRLYHANDYGSIRALKNTLLSKLCIGISYGKKFF